jgi:biotin transport system substrate-specific component
MNTSSGNYTAQLTLQGLMTALICILAPLSIPLPGGVPISLTNMVLYLITYLIGGKRSTICYVIYLLLGLVGLPVFSGFTGGVGKLAGPTGGYLIGFIFITIICGLFLKIGKGKMWMYVMGMLLGLAVAYLFGTLWFMYSNKTGLWQTLTICVFPFLLVDLVKIILIALVAPMVKKPLRHIEAMRDVIQM